jgi:protein SCO1
MEPQMLKSSILMSFLMVSSQQAVLAHEGHKHKSAALVDPQAFQRSQVYYQVPSIALMRNDGITVSMVKEIDPRRPVFISFVFTTCASICPMMSQTFAGLQDLLGADSGVVQLISISIDPEHDTPAKLSEYALTFRAGKQWRLYTGPVDAIQSFQKAFGITSLDKMNHSPAIFYHPGSANPRKKEPWVRLEGFTSPDDLFREYKRSGR